MNDSEWKIEGKRELEDLALQVGPRRDNKIRICTGIISTRLYELKVLGQEDAGVRLKILLLRNLILL